MCTVTWLNQGGKYFCTSNRDELVTRHSSEFPSRTRIGERSLYFPKDQLAGGTWFAMDDQHRFAVLLNGAFEKHKHQPPYTKSRGLVLLDILASAHPSNFFREVNLIGVEPFTLILFHDHSLTENRWDGKNHHQKSLVLDGHYIWSSCTLYDADMRAMRATLFETFYAENKKLDSESIFAFHGNNHGDQENGYVMQRPNGLQTVSITQVVMTRESSSMRFLDLQTRELKSLELQQIPA
jgi:uncharacterized protein with NRDE domain